MTSGPAYAGPLLSYTCYTCFCLTEFLITSTIFENTNKKDCEP